MVIVIVCGTEECAEQMARPFRGHSMAVVDYGDRHVEFFALGRHPNSGSLMG